MRTKHVHYPEIAFIEPLLNMWNKGRRLMSETPLRLVEKDTVNKNKALDAAVTQIERAFGKES